MRRVWPSSKTKHSPKFITSERTSTRSPDPSTTGTSRACFPGMQSSFVEIGLERDAFLYITDFMEEAPDSEEFDTTPAGDRTARAPRLANGEQSGESGGAKRNGGRDDRSSRGRRGGRDRNRNSGRQGGSAPPPTAGRRARRGWNQRRRQYGLQRVQRRLERLARALRAQR